MQISCWVVVENLPLLPTIVHKGFRAQPSPRRDARRDQGEFVVWRKEYGGGTGIRTGDNGFAGRENEDE